MDRLPEDAIRSSTPSHPSIGRKQLLRAIERGDIYPVFQPIVVLPARAVAGFEVLARWQDERLGLVAPCHFIRVAEQEGLIAPLMAQVIHTACSAAAACRGRFHLSFNISPLQLRTPALPSEIETIVRRTGFPVSRIQIELTESALIDDLHAARCLITQFKALGMQVTLDDFGTGFSSLTWLQALPFDGMKIDASFVRSITTSRDCRKIVSAIIALGQNLGMPVIAEGIETRDEAWLLTRFGCDLGQGYLFGRPSPAGSIPAVLDSLGESVQH